MMREELELRFPHWAERIALLRFEPSAKIRRVDNDGSAIFYNEAIIKQCSRETAVFYMAQQLTHIQLAHHARRMGRDRLLWRHSTDAVVNTMLRADGFQLPPDAVLLKGAGEQSAEEMYNIVQALEDRDALFSDAAEADTEPLQAQHSHKGGSETGEKELRLEDPGLAAAVRGLAEMLQPSMQVDYDWFPGSTIRDGMLRYDFRAYPVAQAEILLDTSASVDADKLRYFVRGVKALLREDAVIRVGCFDTRFYGFQDVYTEDDIENLRLQGAGGTDFSVAVAAFTGDAENRIIFTDGYAQMPEESCDAVWVVCGNITVHPPGGSVIYVKPNEEKEKHEVDFLIT